MAPVINAQNLFKRYPGFAPVLRGVNLQVEPGEMVAIMGPSGCGKSTMLHILGLLHAPDSGSLEILNVNALALDREQTAAFRRGNMGFVMQASNLFEHSTVFENVEFPLIYENVPPQERWGRVIRALDLVRLSARVHYPGNRLSGGEQQRVAIARAMVNNPRILLADEPTGALDARTSRLIMENFRNLCHSGGVAMVMVTHDPAMAEFCDTVYTLAEGTLHCQKKGVPPFAEVSAGSFLDVPSPKISGALIADFFPDQNHPDLAVFAARLHKESLLSRIYSLRRHYLRENRAGYALPLPVRYMNFLSKLLGFRMFFRRARTSDSLWRLWQLLPARAHAGIGLWRRISSFLSGAIIARWALQDNIRFFWGAGAGASATATWVAASLMRLPFAFRVRPEDLSRSSINWKIKAVAAKFVLCPSRTVLRQTGLILGTDKANLLLIYPPPIVMPTPEELELLQSRESASHIEIVATGGDFSKSGYKTILAACSRLKLSGVTFRLSILGLVSRKEKKLAEKAALKMEMQYLGTPHADNIAESFKTADIFIACEPDDSAQKLIIPEFLAEALIFGVTIAASGLSEGMAEILNDQENCLMAPQGNSEVLAKNLEKLCKDGAERKRLGATARTQYLSLLDLQGTDSLLTDLVTQTAIKPEQVHNNHEI